MSENTRLLSILQIIGMIGSSLSESEFDALVDALFEEVGVERPRQSGLVVARTQGD